MLHFLADCNKTLIIPKSYHHLQSFSSIIILISNYGTISSSISCISLINHQKLLNSYGIKSSTKPVSSIKYFESFGFSERKMRNIISKAPSIHFYDVSRNHKPKFDFLLSIGLSQQDVIKAVTSDPYILWRSLLNHLIPAFVLFKHYYGGQEIAADRIKIRKCLPHNVKTLWDLGVLEAQILKIVAGASRCRICADTKPHYFKKVVMVVMDMGFDTSSASFERAVHAMAWHCESGWLKKLNAYKSLSFSEGEIHDMFKKQPFLLLISEKKLRAATKFSFEKFHWSLSHLVKTPNSLMYSLGKRVVPRCSVVQILVSRKNFKKVNLLSILIMTENKFLERCVNNYKDEIP